MRRGGALRPAVEVTVAPVVMTEGVPAGAGAGAAMPVRGEVVQAPGWIEADPFDVAVPALAGGVIKDLLVLEGQHVVAGEVVARMVDDDAKLAVQRADAAVAQADAALEQARGEAAMNEALSSAMHDDYNRKQALVKTGAVSEGDVAQLRLKVSAHDSECYASRSAVRKAEADAKMARVVQDEAKLALDRMQVRAPVAGVVLRLQAVPGQRMMLDANDPFAGVVVRLYDPEHIQVRVDVPLADAGKVKIGDKAEITTETLGDRKFKGHLTRFVHEADIQKNTVQVKVAVEDPAPELKPEMLVKARIFAGTRAAGGDAKPGEMQGMPGMPGMDMGGSASAADGGAVLMPKTALAHMAGMPEMAWVVNLQTSTAEMRHLRLGGEKGDALVVLEGLRPGDRVIVNPPESIRDGTKVRAKEGA